MNITLSLPSAVRISCIAISDPSASPSGFSCVTTTASRSCELVEHELAARAIAVGRHRFAAPHPADASSSVIASAVDRVVVLERQRRGVLERQLGAIRALKVAVRERRPSSEAARTCSSPSTLTYTRAWRRSGLCLDSGNGHESNARVLQIFRNRVAQHRPHRLVNASHPAVIHPIPSRSSIDAKIRRIETPSGKRPIEPPLHPVGVVRERRQRAARERRRERRPLP